jgi:hypothetical protein
MCLPGLFDTGHRDACRRETLPKGEKNMTELGPGLTDEELQKYLRSMEVLQAILMRDGGKAPGLMNSFADELEKADRKFPHKEAFLIAVEKFEAEYFKREPPLTEAEKQVGREMVVGGITLFDLEQDSFRPEVEKKSLLPN